MGSDLAAAVADVKAWPPARYSAPLSPDFPSAGDRLIALVELAWRLPNGEPVVLDEWQRQLIRAMLEVYPPGHARAGQLRYRQVFVSVARQNGKSLLGAILALFGLVREAGALVIGIASSADQARIVYARTLKALRSHPSLHKRFQRVTDTRGIESIDGSRYEVKASKSAAVQGLDVSLGLVDELHLTPPVLWSDLVNGTRARANGLVAGITTAGDESSKLLLEMYRKVEKGEGGERFGFFIWESPDARPSEDDAVFARQVAAASPGVACGRIDVETAVADARSLPEADVTRYVLNRFGVSLNSFIPASEWAAVARDEDEELPAGRAVFAVDLTPEWSHATIAAAVRDSEGVVHTELVVSIAAPRLEQLVSVCTDLARHAPSAFVVDGYSLRRLGKELEQRGLPVQILTQGDVLRASPLLFHKVKARTLRHGNEPLLALQVPRTVRKNVGESYRISRKDSSVEIDAVIATMMAVYVADTTTDYGPQIFGPNAA